MKLWLMKNDKWDNDYEQYDSAVVAAETEEDVRKITHLGAPCDKDGSHWAGSPENVSVHYLGEAKKGANSGVILSSYNGG